MRGYATPGATPARGLLLVEDDPVAAEETGDRLEVVGGRSSKGRGFRRIRVALDEPAGG